MMSNTFENPSNAYGTLERALPIEYGGWGLIFWNKGRMHGSELSREVWCLCLRHPGRTPGVHIALPAPSLRPPLSGLPQHPPVSILRFIPDSTCFSADFHWKVPVTVLYTTKPKSNIITLLKYC